MAPIFFRGITSSGNSVSRLAVSPAEAGFLFRHLPSLARMGTAISVMLLSDVTRRAQLTSCSRLKAAPIDSSPDVLLQPPLMITDRPEVGMVPKTKSYPAEGFFTGVRSSVIVAQPSDRVFDSLSTDLHLLFGAIEECKDRVTSNDDVDCQLLHRFVRIPFTIGYFNGALKMTMAVSNDRRKGEIGFQCLSKSRFLSDFAARFTVTSIYGADSSEQTLVELDSRVAVKRLPPPPLKGLVKGVIIRKMDRCMKDLVDFHSSQLSPEDRAAAPCYMNNVQSLGSLERKLNTERRDERHSIL